MNGIIQLYLNSIWISVTKNMERKKIIHLTTTFVPGAVVFNVQNMSTIVLGKYIKDDDLSQINSRFSPYPTRGKVKNLQ